MAMYKEFSKVSLFIWLPHGGTAVKTKVLL